MTDLQQAICNIKADELNCVDFDSVQWQTFVQSNAELFAKVQQTKPDSSVNHHLLGLLTKNHIEVLSRIEAHQQSVQAMQQALSQKVGEKHAASFHYRDGEQLVFITHLWLYLQGYMAMDFSLANDHAEQSATALTRAVGGDVQEIRSDFMSSFYQGKGHSNSNEPTNPLIKWIRSLFE